MSSFFTVASSTKLTDAAPSILTFPFTVGMWCYPTVVDGTQHAAWWLGDTATVNNLWALRIGNTNLWTITCRGGGTANNATAGTAVVNTWQFVVVRVLAANNRWVQDLQESGVITSGQTTTSRTPTGVDTLAIGCDNNSTPADFFGGAIAGYFLLNGDITSKRS